MPFKTGWGCVPNDSVIAPLSTGQGRRPRLASNLPESAAVSGLTLKAGSAALAPAAGFAVLVPALRAAVSLAFIAARSRAISRSITFLISASSFFEAASLRLSSLRRAFSFFDRLATVFSRSCFSLLSSFFSCSSEPNSCCLVLRSVFSTRTLPSSSSCEALI